MFTALWWKNVHFCPTLRPGGDAWHNAVVDYRRIPVGYTRGRFTAVSAERLAVCEQPRLELDFSTESG